jgi:hypothetical protein
MAGRAADATAARVFPAIHVLSCVNKEVVDARPKAGHDEEREKT